MEKEELSLIFLSEEQLVSLLAVNLNLSQDWILELQGLDKLEIVECLVVDLPELDERHQSILALDGGRA
jgi:hypothetical protein